jgi:hypothetical protein
VRTAIEWCNYHQARGQCPADWDAQGGDGGASEVRGDTVISIEIGADENTVSVIGARELQDGSLKRRNKPRHSADGAAVR